MTRSRARGSKDFPLWTATQTAAQWFLELQQQRAQQQQFQKGSNPSTSVLILGPQLLVAIGNFAKNVEGRVRIVQIIASKS